MLLRFFGLFLPCGNFIEDYGIFASLTMEKWQARVEIVKYWGANATVGLHRRPRTSIVVPAPLPSSPRRRGSKFGAFR
ncbi:MAG: hypothetical protein WCC39_07025, partial [Telluria sp.]